MLINYINGFCSISHLIYLCLSDFVTITCVYYVIHVTSD